MLKQRILTAFILGPLILWSVVAFSHRALAVEFGVILTIAAWEWARLSGIHHQFGRIAYSVGTAGAMLGITILMHTRADFLQPILSVVVIGWFVALVAVFVFDRQKKHEPKPLSGNNIAINLIFGLIILIGAFIALTGMHRLNQYGYVFILILLILIWVADSAAYFSGKAFGKHKLAPQISPGKTWEGVIGAFMATLVCAFIVTILLEYSVEKAVFFIVIALLTVMISIVGDLIESLFKRRANMKDSSHLLPGHGGILDRVDSLLAAAPVFLFGLLLAGI